MNISKDIGIKGFLRGIAILTVLAVPLAVCGASLVSVSTGPATVTIIHATVFGTVDAHGSPTYAWFEYGEGNALTLNTNKRYVSMNAGPTLVSFQLDGLKKNVQYSYRVVAYNAYGTAHGDVRTFIAGVPGGGSAPSASTGGGTSVTTNSSGAAQALVITKGATNITPYTAHLHGTAFPASATSIISWFEFGPTPDVDIKTALQSLTLSASVDFSERISGLTPGKRYYYRAVVQTPAGIHYGDTLSSTTAGVSNDTTIKPIPKPVAPKAQPGKEDDCPKGDASVLFTPASHILAPDRTYSYVVVVRNNTTEPAHALDLTIQLPLGMTFVADEETVFVHQNGVLTSRGNEIPAHGDKIFTFRIKAARTLEEGDTVTITAIARFTNSTGMRDAVGYATVTVSSDESTANEAASVFNGSNWISAALPWIIAGILLLLIILLGLTLYSKYQKQKQAGETGV